MYQNLLALVLLSFSAQMPRCLNKGECVSLNMFTPRTITIMVTTASTPAMITFQKLFQAE